MHLAQHYVASLPFETTGNTERVLMTASGERGHNVSLEMAIQLIG